MKNNNKSQGQGEKKQSREWFDALIIAALIATLLRVFVIESYRIPTGSMERTLLAGDFLFVTKFEYGAKVPFTNFRLPGITEVKRGDVIVFKFPKDRSLNYIKRCIAMAGDTVEIRNREVLVNGVVQPLPPEAQFLASMEPSGVEDVMIFPPFSGFNKDNYGPIRVPRKGDVIPLNMRSFPLYNALVSDEGHEITMQAGNVFVDGIMVDSYTVEQNYYFAMGDNRDNSLDSRFWGFLPESDLVGKALMVYWSWNPDVSLLTNPVEKISSIRLNRSGLMVH
uniref:Signal peptidase I n=1 Tax=Chlorobium chlorochromatii (strain CaD3) TaxID=340177 RepID=Q3ATB1_CHLCH